MNILQDLEELNAQLTQREEEIKQMHHKRDSLIAEVRRTLAEVSRSAPLSRTKRANGTKTCSICDFATHPPHDSRAHKKQQVKQPFTAEELLKMDPPRARITTLHETCDNVPAETSGEGPKDADFFSS